MTTHKFGIDKKNIVESIEHLIDLSSKSNVTKEIFIVASENEWVRLYWNPVSKMWLVTYFPSSTTLQLQTQGIKETIKRLSSRYPDIKGFQYRSSPEDLDIYLSR